MTARNLPDAAARREAAAVAGHTGDEATARSLLRDEDARVRVTALGALERLGTLHEADVLLALGDPDPSVRRRACEAAGRSRRGGSGRGGSGLGGAALLAALDDADAVVAEMAAWALGELEPPPAGAVEALSRIAGQHGDALCREAAVAALGAIGDPAGLPAILAATGDKPAIRRRAILALAPFDGPEVDAALRAARADRDWQVRQAAEDLSDPRP